jgi:hypothetical protein
MDIGKESQKKNLFQKFKNDQKWFLKSVHETNHNDMDIGKESLYLGISEI